MAFPFVLSSEGFRAVHVAMCGHNSSPWIRIEAEKVNEVGWVGVKISVQTIVFIVVSWVLFPWGDKRMLVIR
jgi:hypothetical protein